MSKKGIFFIFEFISPLKLIIPSLILVSSFICATKIN